MPKDNHSVMQYYLDGPKNYFFTFFFVKEKNSIKINSENLLIFSNIFGETKKEKIKEFIFLHLRPLLSLYKIIISIIK